jgi:hypothetical protein
VYFNEYRGFESHSLRQHCMQQTLAIRSQWLLWLPLWGIVHEGAFFDDGSLNSFILNILINVNQPAQSFPRGLKPSDFLGVFGTAEVVPFQSPMQDLWRGENEKKMQVRSTPLKYASLRMTEVEVGEERTANAGPIYSAEAGIAQASSPSPEWILAMSSFGCTGLASTSKS